MSNKAKAIVEHAVWAAAFTVVGGLTADQVVSAAHLPPEAYVLMPAIALVLSSAKSFLASKVGDKNSIEVTNSAAIQPAATKEP